MESNRDLLFPPRISNRECPPDMSVREWQIALRQQAAREAPFEVEHVDQNRIWGDYTVRSGNNKYRVAFRGVHSDRNYCSCLDFRTSGLGTCKHVEAVTLYLAREIPGYPWTAMPFTPEYSSIYVSYQEKRVVKLSLGSNHRNLLEKWSKHYFTEDLVLPPEHYDQINKIFGEAQAISPDFRCYEDVFDFIDNELAQSSWEKRVENSFPDKRFVSSAVDLSSFTDEQMSFLYRVLHQGYGLLVARQSAQLNMQVVAMIAYILEQQPGRALIVGYSPRSVAYWRERIAYYLPDQTDISICTPDEINNPEHGVSGLFSFVYVENSAKLSDWNLPLSLTIKKLAIKHLYMQTHSLSRITPIQLSSIVQHVSPFLISPIYLFIKNYRDQFPLHDDFDSLPVPLKPFTFFFQADKEVVLPAVALHGVKQTKQKVQKKIARLMKLLVDIAEDPDALAAIKEMITPQEGHEE